VKRAQSEGTAQEKGSGARQTQKWLSSWRAAEACPPAAPDAPQRRRGPRRLFRSMLSKIENELASPSLTTLHRLCKALTLSISDLLSNGKVDPWVIMRPDQRKTIGHRNAAGTEGVSAEVLFRRPRDACSKGSWSSSSPVAIPTAFSNTRAKRLGTWWKVS